MDLVQQLQHLQKTVDKLQGVLASIGTSISELGENLLTAARQIAAHDSDLAALRARVDQLERNAANSQSRKE